MDKANSLCVGNTRIPIYVGEHGICFESQIQGAIVGFFWQNQLRPEKLRGSESVLNICVLNKDLSCKESSAK
jgi:hypothetical protein